MANPLLSVGDAAPEFDALPLSRGEVEELSSAALRGKRYILYFYPKDDTPGCTTQACDFRDQRAAFAEAGYEIYGVSPDSLKRHERFQDKYQLPFPLVSDPEHTLAERFGVWREKKNYGRVYFGIVRSTFVIDEEGTLLHCLDNVRAKGHVERLLALLAEG